MRAVFTVVIGTAALAVAGRADAQASTDLTFSGTVDDACSITSPSDGELGLSSDYALLSSKVGTGFAGGATVVSTDDNNTLVVDAATAFVLEPQDGGVSVTFDAEYDTADATIATNVPAGDPTVLEVGSTTVSVDAWAEKSAGIFPAGDYTMDVTVRCIVN